MQAVTSETAVGCKLPRDSHRGLNDIREWGSPRRTLPTAAGVRVIPLHGLRHTHATLLLENGESLKYVAERLGDREDTVLETYSHVTSKMRSDAVSRLASLIDGRGFPTETRSVREHSVSREPELAGFGS